MRLPIGSSTSSSRRFRSSAGARSRRRISFPEHRASTTRLSATPRRSATGSPTGCWCARGRRPSAQSSAARELLTVESRQSYYTDERASQFDPNYAYGTGFRPPSPYSPVSLTARAAPTVPIGIDFRMEYDPTVTAEIEAARVRPQRRDAHADDRNYDRLEPPGLRRQQQPASVRTTTSTTARR